ncbi:hypothetical protein A3L09_03560 [Thermococcus profundus]|uniref:4Fe-4S ferredoxin-type domain-containing protein n=1 Tax=Thermococcus profundus TaxID=49899 RepID=A0A2Z2MAD6_THEPR|nr:4Fe-4S dicluster domain-containing protein [Thermococcus profundus]ASJ02393.1 hypothetical protein A3L09_03560 [Thermococcus profundus]
MNGREYLLHVLSEKCTGCGDCVEACPMDEPAIRIPEVSGGWDVVVCRHCSPAPCVEACEFGALWVKDDGTVFLARELCTSCKACTAVCPFGAVFLGTTGEMVKCDLCKGKPRCVEACREGALIYDRFTEKKALMEEKKPVKELLAFRGLV